MRDLAGAIRDFTQALHLNPSDGKAYYNRGMARLEMQDVQGATHDLAMAYENGVMQAKEALLTLQN
jgi:regulator of sirC expression with transglutaminase-like and TPR domain